ncbi:MAG: glycosyltransferase family 4 protein [Acidobacteria bacterium]|nr:glycosyltransferase family 4 protein [Acidobacteriota bacterium]
MKALIVATAVYSLEGGLERFNRRLVRSLDELRERGEVGEIRLMGLWDTSTSAAAPPGVKFFAGDSARPRFVATFIAHLLRHRPDVIIYAHVNFAPRIALGHLVAPRARHFLTVHGVEVWERPPAVKEFIVRRFVDTVMAVSRFTARTMGGAYGMEEARFRFLANALDVPAGENPEHFPTMHEAEGDWRLLVVTRLSLIDTHKNVDKVILALPAVRARFPGTRCDIVGDGPWRGRLEEIAREAGVSSCVRFHGVVDEDLKESLYASSDVFVLPSTGEGFGIVFLEAWRHRLPVVTSREGAAPEVVRDGIDGRCVGTRPEEIAAAVVDLLADPERRRAMGEAGHRRLRESFTHEVFRQRLGEILEEAATCAA